MKKAAKRILCIDDEVNVLHALTRVFRKSPYEAQTTTDGKTAIQRIETWAPHLIFLDINMPGIDGYHLLDEIRNKIELEGLPVVLISGRKANNDIITGYSKGAIYYITKPFTNQQVRHVADYLIGNLSRAEKESLEFGPSEMR